MVRTLLGPEGKKPKMRVKALFHRPTSTLTYLVYDPKTRDAVVIDPVLDFDALTWRLSEVAIDEVVKSAKELSLNIRWILDTHAHADHITGMERLKARLGASTAIGKNIVGIQKLFAEVYNLQELQSDGSQWDFLLADREQVSAGSITITCLPTPGHTPACMSYLIDDLVFTGDALFMPDYGTGRCDFPGGSAGDLYDSVTDNLYTLPDTTRVASRAWAWPMAPLTVGPATCGPHSTSRSFQE